MIDIVSQKFRLFLSGKTGAGVPIIPCDVRAKASRAKIEQDVTSTGPNQTTSLLTFHPTLQPLKLYPLLTQLVTLSSYL